MKEVEIVVLGSDINTYTMARSYYELYHKKVKVIGKEVMKFTEYSNILDISYDQHLRESEGFVKCLVTYAKNLKAKEKILLIPTHDIYLRLMALNRQELEKYYVFNIPSLEIAQNFLDKESFYTKYQNMGLTFPQTYFFDCAKEKKAKVNLPFPIIIKPSNGIEYNKNHFPGRAKVYKVKTKEEMDEVITRIIKSGYKGKLILQELVLGDDSTLFDCLFYVSKQKKPVLCTFAQIGLQEHDPLMVGNCTVLINGYSQYKGVKETINKIKHFLEDIGYQGYAEVDLKYDLKDQQFKVLEINPRQGRCAYYLTATGNNLVKLLIDDLFLNQPKKFHIVKKEILLSMVPKYVVKHYINNEKYRTKALTLYKKKRVVDSLDFKQDKSFKRRWYLINRDINFVKKYRKYNW